MRHWGGSRATWSLWGLICLATVVAPAGKVKASGGILIPWSVSSEPDPSVLALRSMDVQVVIDDLHAEVRISQVWENLTATPIEGKYLFPLGERARLRDFALWEGDHRMQGAVVEKMRGRRIYEEITRQQIDPGLLETSDDPEDQGVFSLRVSPIPAWGTTRIELVYEEELDVGSLAAQLTVPLAPRRHAPLTAGAFSASVEVISPVAMDKVTFGPPGWFPSGKPPRVSYAGTNVVLSDDLTVNLRLAPPKDGVGARLVSFRDPDSKPRTSYATWQERGPLSGASWPDDGSSERGYFAARATFARRAANAPPPRPRDVVVLLDTSLSMQWDKLDLAVAAVEELLGKRLGKDDRFALVLFHDEVRPWKDKLVAATAADTGAALDFLRRSYLAGGSDLAGALAVGGKLLADDPRSGADRDLVLITDGHPTAGELDYKKLLAASAGLGDARLFVLGVGDDVNGTLLGRLAEARHGAYAVAGEGDRAFAIATFLDKLGKDAYHGVALELPPAAGVDLIYATSTTAFDGTDVLFFGRYATPQPRGKGSIVARDDAGAAMNVIFDAPLLAKDTSRPHVARGWAWRRVRDLLDRIRVDGEDEAMIREVIALARRHKFVTPYTSFIAAPRALLRPRNFQAGDPLLRVKTGPEIKGVTAIFPFGLTKALEYVEGEDVWETRFLAPAWMTDGSYGCTLVLTDAAGRKIREDKRFTIDSRPPEVKVSLDRGAVRAGDRLVVTARADQDVRHLRARIEDGPQTDIIWLPAAKASVGELLVPADLQPGEHRIHIVAEDFARNTTLLTITFTVVGT